MPYLGDVLLSCEGGVNGAFGNGRWPTIPWKLSRVGVFADGSSALTSALCCSLGKNLMGRGVVGVVSSPSRPGGGSETVKVVLTARNPDIVPLQGVYNTICRLPSRVWRMRSPTVECSNWDASQTVVESDRKRL